MREATIRDAPKPIAEAALALDAARNAHQARDAMWALVHAATRYVGVVALATFEYAPAVAAVMRA